MAAAAIRQFKTAATFRERLRGNLLALVVLCGAHDLLPDRVIVGPQQHAGIIGHLEFVLGRRVHVCAYIAPARAVRKPVLQLIDDRGRTFAFAKLGADEFTDGLVRREHDIVEKMSAVQWRHLRMPEVLHAGTWNGHPLLVQSALPRGRVPTAGATLLHNAMTELARSLGTTTLPLASSSYLGRLEGHVASLPNSEHRAQLLTALTRLTDETGDLALEFGSSHGDWAPWNMAISKHEQCLLVWDWEKFERDSPVGIDAVHYEVQGRVVLHGLEPAEAFNDALRHADRLLRINAAPARLIIALYAIDLATRYLMDGEHEAGTARMSNLHHWLEPVLEMVTAGQRR